MCVVSNPTRQFGYNCQKQRLLCGSQSRILKINRQHILVSSIITRINCHMDEKSTIHMRGVRHKLNVDIAAVLWYYYLEKMCSEYYYSHSQSKCLGSFYVCSSKDIHSLKVTSIRLQTFSLRLSMLTKLQKSPVWIMALLVE